MSRIDGGKTFAGPQAISLDPGISPTAVPSSDPCPVEPIRLKADLNIFDVRKVKR